MVTLPTDRDWKLYGKKAPYFGVTGQDIHLNENLDNHILEEFFKSGVEDVANLFATIRTRIDSRFTPRNILDHGCGPGRMIIPFSANAEEVVGIDVSLDMLEEARKNCKKFNVKNVRFYEADHGFQCLEGQKFDLVHSFIVLQHLNIQRGTRVFERLLNVIEDGGIGALHVTYHDNHTGRKWVNYLRFRIPYLAYFLKFGRSLQKGKKFSYYPQMQMNKYSLNTLFAVLQNSGINDIHVKFTNHYDYFGALIIFKIPES